MALAVATGTVTISTGAVGTTFTVSGLSFQPKLILFHWSGRATAGQAEGDHRFGMGAARTTTSRCCLTTQSDHGNTTCAADNAKYNDSCIAALTIAGAVDGKVDLDALLSDGFRLIVDDQFATALIVGYLAIGGDDLTDVAIVEQAVSGTGDTTVTCGFQPDAVVFLASGGAAIGSVDTDSLFMLGAAAWTPSLTNAVLSGLSDDGQGTMITCSYCRAGESIGVVGVDVVARRGSVTARSSTGFTLNITELSGAFTAFCICVKGGQWQVGDSLTSTGGTNQVEGTAFVPKALLVASHNKAASTADTTQPHDERSVGFATGAAARNYSSIIDKDAATAADIGVDFNTTAMYGNQSTAATVVVEGLMDLVSFDGTPSFTFVMDDPDPVASFFWYLAMGDNPAAGGGEVFFEDRHPITMGMKAQTAAGMGGVLFEDRLAA